MWCKFNQFVIQIYLQSICITNIFVLQYKNIRYEIFLTYCFTAFALANRKKMAFHHFFQIVIDQK